MIDEARTTEERNEVKNYICYECVKSGMTTEMITELMYYAKAKWEQM